MGVIERNENYNTPVLAELSERGKWVSTLLEFHAAPRLYCLSSAICYAWTEYKFTCVCMCVSVTLSVNLPTDQTPQRISTVDSLKDADLRQDVPFRGLDDD